MSDTLITTIPQIDGTSREIHAQDTIHTRRARALLRQDPALVERLHGVDGIQIRIVDRTGAGARARKAARRGGADG